VPEGARVAGGAKRVGRPPVVLGVGIAKDEPTLPSCAQRLDEVDLVVRDEIQQALRLWICAPEEELLSEVLCDAERLLERRAVPLANQTFERRSDGFEIGEVVAGVEIGRVARQGDGKGGSFDGIPAASTFATPPG